nr:serine carboxypeptidase-like 40 [Quercus suber]
MVDYFGSHAIISDQDVYQIHKYCDFSPNATSQSRECEASYGALEENIIDINVYNIYAPMCFSSDVTTRPKKASILEFDPCSTNYMYVYLNRPDVQEALHANVTKLTHDWELCGDTIQVWRDSPSTIIPLLKEFMSNGIRVWIFSGDIDGRVPVTSTKYSINKMKLPVKTAWHPWFLNKEVGGYTQVYEGDLTFATVREAGHQVPSYQPARALSLIKHFLEGKPLH